MSNFLRRHGDGDGSVCWHCQCLSGGAAEAFNCRQSHRASNGLKAPLVSGQIPPKLSTPIIGAPEHYRNILRTYQKIAKLYGIRKEFHTLRHSAGTLLRSLGIPAATVSTILGHSRTSITHDIYTHALPEDSRRAVEELSKLIGS